MKIFIVVSTFIRGNTLQKSAINVKFVKADFEIAGCEAAKDSWPS